MEKKISRGCCVHCIRVEDVYRRLDAQDVALVALKTDTEWIKRFALAALGVVGAVFVKILVS